MICHFQKNYFWLQIRIFWVYPVIIIKFHESRFKITILRDEIPIFRLTQCKMDGCWYNICHGSLYYIHIEHVDFNLSHFNFHFNYTSEMKNVSTKEHQIFIHINLYTEIILYKSFEKSQKQQINRAEWHSQWTNENFVSKNEGYIPKTFKILSLKLVVSPKYGRGVW